MSGSMHRLARSIGCLVNSSLLSVGCTAMSRRSVSIGVTPFLRFPRKSTHRHRGGNTHKTQVLNSTILVGAPPNPIEGRRDGDVALPPLRCPGGPRLKSVALKQLFKVPHAGYLAKYDQRFIINLKLTHQLISKLARTAFRTPDKLLIELGPGAGSLTRSLLTRPCVGVFGIEMDERFNPHLEQIRILTKDKFKWINADMLKISELDAIRAHFPRFYRMNIRKRPTEEEEGEVMKDTAAPSASPFQDNATKGFDDDRPNSSNLGIQSRTGENWREGSKDDGEGEGDDFAPLRSRSRDLLLRKRLPRFGFDKDPNEGFQTRSKRARWESDEGISPNPALDVSDGWWANGDAKVEVVANLPFDIITELLMRYAVDCSRKAGLFAFGRVPLHIFTQKEVADRIVAQPGSVHFSRLSVLCQAYFHVKTVRVFQEWTYYPRTEVLGALLTLEPRSVPLTGGDAFDGATLIHFTNFFMAPGQRGASVHKALRGFMPDEVAQHILQESRMDGATAVLEVSVEELVKMAVMWKRFLTASQQNSMA
ncbi:unnamed protein product [Phytomonas sp. EM1]|nr:unnamed protein product [Phytomonas sp. EM1]|eukprot:CCW64876.1 unnamed protein product [Phytomonas sp. isolate EM1]